MNGQSRPWRDGGFTLLELLVAITLIGLVLVALYGGLRVGMNSWESGEARAEAINRQRLVQEFLRRQLAQSVTVHIANERGERLVRFAGQASAIEFVAPLLAYLGQAGLYWIRLEGRDGQLRMLWRPYLSSDPQAGELQETVLLEGVTAMEWAYFGVERDEEPQVQAQWHSAWTSALRRPWLVRLNLTVDREVWPDLVTALSEGPP